MQALRDDVVAAVREGAIELTGRLGDYDALMDRIGGARVVLIGEASHGTHEFYDQRAEITKRLIREKGFSAVAVEADWPDAPDQSVCAGDRTRRRAITRRLILPSPASATW